MVKDNSANFVYYEKIILKITFKVFISNGNNFVIYYHLL